MKRLTVILKDDIHHQLKLEAVKRDKNMSDLVTQWIEDGLKRLQESKKK
ncbi:MAG: hypothetical protein HQM08_29735 [Candidatus Riflebacteria bacterium]|nr:hypothetical protein [Candidatus Riflebacteria bacterium]